MKPDSLGGSQFATECDPGWGFDVLIAKLELEIKENRAEQEALMAKVAALLLD